MRLFWKIYLASLCSLLFCAVLLTAIVSYREARHSLTQLRDEQRLLAMTAASQVETGYYDQVWPFEMLSGIARGQHFVAWQIVDGNGAVVLASVPDNAGLAGTVEATEPRLIHIDDSDHEFWVMPLRMRDGTASWQFRLGYHTAAIRAQIRSIIKTNALIGLALAIVFLGTSLYVTLRVLRPLNSLTEAAAEMARGNLEVSLPATGSDELGQLVRGFATMVASVKERDAAIQGHLTSLERARADLETRVAMRTQELHTSETRTRAIIQYAADAIITLDDVGRVDLFNPAAERVFGYPLDAIVGQPFATLLAAPYTVHVDQLRIERREVGGIVPLGSLAEIHGQRRGGELFPMSIALSAVETDGKRLFTAIVRDISDRKRAEAEKQALHQRLLEASRQAGMADIAIDVLHNVGNVLNSVNVSVELLHGQLRDTRMTSLAKVTALLRGHEADLGDYLTRDPRGKLLPEYLEKLAGALTAERASMVTEAVALQGFVDHIKRIVESQQSHTRGRIDLREVVDLAELVETALRASDATMPAPHIDVARTYDPLPPAKLDRHKASQILITLLDNAKMAVSQVDGSPRIRLLLSREDGRAVRLDVIDNGVGIGTKDLLRIFNHDFTRRNARGFGLHAAALAAGELGGSLSAHSDGLGQGARFTLILPFGADVHPSPEPVIVVQ